ncbi:hypothetical protein JCM10908_003976 [Rhodotorula pacifica]|uniref:uncharacterized protein n=1 Tax=Rhodotorula pacifica TaxID=1495444 RepID=UPI003173DBEC
MNRFRRKSDAKRRSTKGSSPILDEKERDVEYGSTTPAGEPPLVQLPNTDDFRTSLILPNLMRRFSLLRGQDGQLVDLETIQNHLAIQRQTGRLTAYEVDAVLEQYRLQTGIESNATSHSLPKRKRIDWTQVEDETAFLDSLSQSSVPYASSTIASSSRTSYLTANDETRSSLTSSMARPPVPPVPEIAFSGVSAALGPLASPSPPESTTSAPLSRQSSAGAASTTSQGYPYRVARGTNSLFGGRAHDARELRMLRSASGHSLEANSSSCKGVIDECAGNETELEKASPSLESESPPLSRTVLSPAADDEVPRRSHRPTTSADFPAPPTSQASLPTGQTEEAADSTSQTTNGLKEASPPRSPTTPLSAKQLRRISHALDAIEVELAKTFTRMSWTAEEQGEEENVAVESVDGNRLDECTEDAPHDGSLSAGADTGGEGVGGTSEGGSSSSVLNVPLPLAAEAAKSAVSDDQLFELVDGPSMDTIPPSPISPITESDLRGIGTFDSTAPRVDFDVLAASSETSDTEELDPLFSQAQRAASKPRVEAALAPSSGRGGAIPSAITIPPRPAKLAQLSIETEENDAIGVEDAQPSDAEIEVLQHSADDRQTDANLDASSPATGRSEPVSERDTAGANLARDSFVSLRSNGSSFVAFDDAPPRSDEDFGFPIVPAASSAQPLPASTSSSVESATDSDPRQQRISALANGPSSSARPFSMPFDRRPTEELLQVLAAATKRLSTSDAGSNLYLTHEDVLAIQERLVRNAAAQRAAMSAEPEGTLADSTPAIPERTQGEREVDEHTTEAETPEPAEAAHEDAPASQEDEAVERLAGLGLDDFASKDFTQPSPQQVDAVVFSKAAESSSGSSAGKPSPASYLSPTSVSMVAQNSQQTYDSNITFSSSARSGVTTSPSDAFEYSSLVASPTDAPGGESSPRAALGVPSESERVAIEPQTLGTPYAFAAADHPSRSGETLPAGKSLEPATGAEESTVQQAVTAPPAISGLEPSALEASPAASAPQRVPRRTPAPDRSGATSIMVRDVRQQATLATDALKRHESGTSPTRPLRKKSVRKHSISSPQLVSGPTNIPAVPIASPKILAEASSPRGSASPGSPSTTCRERSASDASKSKGIGSRFRRLLSKREAGSSRYGADAGIASDSVRPTRPSREGTAPITPPNQSTARFESPQHSSPQTPSTVMSSPGGSTPRSSPRKKPLPSTVFPSKRSSLSQSPLSSPASTSGPEPRTNGHARNQSITQIFSSVQEEPANASARVTPETGNGQQLDRSASFSRIEPLSPRRTDSRQESSRGQSPASPASSRSGIDRGRFSRDSVESMLRFRQAAEGLGLDPEKVQELVMSAYADSPPSSSSHAYAGSVSSSAGGHTTLENHEQWDRNREASHGSNATAAGLSGQPTPAGHQRGFSDASLRSQPEGSVPAPPDLRHLSTSSTSSRLADAGPKLPSMLVVPGRGETFDSLTMPRSPGVESATSRQSSSDYANSFLDYYAHEEGETDNEGPFNLSTGSTFEPRGEESIRFSVADGSEGQPNSARVSGAPSGEVVWQVLDDLRTNRFSIASSVGFGSHDSSTGADDSLGADQLAPVADLLRHRDRKRSSASLPSDWDRGRFPSIYLREEQALIELGQQGGVALDESGRFLVRPKLDAPAVPPLPAEYRESSLAAESLRQGDSDHSAYRTRPGAIPMHPEDSA